MYVAKWPGIVLTSRETSTRPASAAIRRTSRDNTGSGTKADCRIQIRVSLKPNAQGCLTGNSRLARSNRSIMSGERGFVALNCSHLSSCSFR
jgi:hypothetical protein